MKKIVKKKREKIRVREIPIYKELKVKEKKNQESQAEEESGLEEQIEESRIIDDREFHEFVNLPANIRTAPVLERIQTQENENLEQNVASTPVATPINPANAIDYVSNNYFSSNYGSGDKRYAESSSAVSPVLERTNVRENLPRQELLNWQEELQVREHSSFMEQGHRVHMTNIESKNEMPFEKKERKYKEFRG